MKIIKGSSTTRKKLGSSYLISAGDTKNNQYYPFCMNYINSNDSNVSIQDLYNSNNLDILDKSPDVPEIIYTEENVDGYIGIISPNALFPGHASSGNFDGYKYFVNNDVKDLFKVWYKNGANILFTVSTFIEEQISIYMKSSDINKPVYEFLLVPFSENTISDELVMQMNTPLNNSSKLDTNDLVELF